MSSVASSRGHIGEVKRCYETELEKHPNLAGRVMVRFTIDPSARSRVGAGRARSIIHLRKAASAMPCGRGSFPKPQGGKVVVSYPFVPRLNPGSDAAPKSK